MRGSSEDAESRASGAYIFRLQSQALGFDTENLPKYGIYYNSTSRVVVVDLATGR